MTGKDAPMRDVTTRPEQPARRSFLKGSVAAGVAASAGMTLNLSEAFAQRGAAPVGPIDLGQGDIAVLNYAYALEQLEAAFYGIVVARPYGGIDRYEHHMLMDIRNHEVAHRTFLRRALGSAAIPDLPVDFSRVDFTSRTSVLTTAATFEDLGVSAYNGAGQYLKDPSNVLNAGRIASVEARHAAVLRDMLQPLTPAFAGDDAVNSLGLDLEASPSAVLPKVAPYVPVKFTYQGV